MAVEPPPVTPMPTSELLLCQPRTDSVTRSPGLLAAALAVPVATRHLAHRVPSNRASLLDVRPARHPRATRRSRSRPARPPDATRIPHSSASWLFSLIQRARHSRTHRRLAALELSPSRRLSRSPLGHRGSLLPSSLSRSALSPLRPPAGHFRPRPLLLPVSLSLTSTPDRRHLPTTRSFRGSCFLLLFSSSVFHLLSLTPSKVSSVDSLSFLVLSFE